MKHLRRLRNKKWLVWVLIVFLMFAIVISSLAYKWVGNAIGNTSNFISDDYAESNLIYDRNGKQLYELFAEKSRISVGISDIPGNLKNATLAIEDANFYQHVGFDIKGLLRGMFRTIFLGRRQGGSTITQQLIKNTRLTPERTLQRKIKEAVLTIAAEMIYSKDQILEMYFNRIPYGGTVWGVAAAAQNFFGKNLNQLSLAEAALLAGLPASPTKYSPFLYPEKAKARQEMVLERMKELKMISPEEEAKAKAEVLTYATKAKNIHAPHFVFYVRNELVKEFGEERVRKGGLKVTTSLDLDLYNFAQEAVAGEINGLQARNASVGNGAVLVTSAKTGEIMAMVGSKDYFDTNIDGQVNITTSLRQPGSSIKPLNYAVAIDMGKITAATVFEDEPYCFGQVNQKSYCPTNYGNAYHGIQSVRNSLGNSLNIPAVKVLKLNGLETFIASASAFGISTFTDPKNYGLSLTLGGGEVKMLDMNVAYGVLANGGVRQDLNSILKVVDKQNTVLSEMSILEGERVLSREAAFIITNILSDDGARGMVFGRGSLLNIKGHPEVAVKTGTTNDLRDNWTIGYTPDWVVTSWVGNSDNTKMSKIVSGTTGAAPIWNKVMTYWLGDKPAKKTIQPTEIIQKTVCNITGGLVPEEGCDSKNEYFKKGTIPPVLKITTQKILIDKTNNKVIKEGENNPNAEWQDKQVIIDPVSGPACLDCAR